MGRLITLHDGETLDVDSPAIIAQLERAIVLPPGPRCSACHHQMCPSCGTWCDTLHWFQSDGTPVDLSPFNSDPFFDPTLDFECCCNGSCLPDPLDAQDYLEQSSMFVQESNDTGRTLVQAHGPYISPRMLRARRAGMQ